MKKILLFLLLILIAIFPSMASACSVPPDILFEWKIDTNQSSDIKLTLTILAWKNLHSQIEKILTEKTHIPFQNENIETIVHGAIVPLTHFSFNNEPVNLTFQSGKIITQNTESEIYTYEPEPILEAVFTINKNLDLQKREYFSLNFDKTPFLEISPLIHPYIVTDFQKNTFSEGYVVDSDRFTYDIFSHNNQTFVIRNETEELDTENYFSLYVGPLTSEYKNPLDSNLPIKTEVKNPQSTEENIDIFSPGKTLRNFFSSNIPLSFQIFGIFIAIISGMAHGLLPGHSKSLLVGYISNGGRIQKREVITLIASVTISHTTFIVILAGIILLFQKGTSFSANIVGNIGAILYTIFGIFFLFQSLKSFQKTSNSLSQFGKKNHPNGCNCCQVQSTKNTIIVGFLAGLVPCVDALALFVAAMSIGNIIYSSIIIISFSIGIGIMLAIIAFSLGSGKNFLHKKGNIFAEKFSHILTLLAGIFLIIIGISHFL